MSMLMSVCATTPFGVWFGHPEEVTARSNAASDNAVLLTETTQEAIGLGVDQFPFVHRPSHQYGEDSSRANREAIVKERNAMVRALSH